MERQNNTLTLTMKTTSRRFHQQREHPHECQSSPSRRALNKGAALFARVTRAESEEEVEEERGEEEEERKGGDDRGLEGGGSMGREKDGGKERLKERRRRGIMGGKG